MSTTHVDTSAELPRPLVSLRPYWIGLAATGAFVAAILIYQHAFGWSAGLDSYSPEFQTYWTNLLTAAIPLSFGIGAGVVGYLWRTRDRHLESVEPRTELQRYLILTQWLAIYALALYLAFSFFTEQTATWHMTAVRDTDFTPANIITFYVVYPAFAIIGAGAFFYAKTRIPFFANGYSLAFLIFAMGPFMAIPNLGLNEWGHTFWLMEEGFASPLHWGFVVFGWMTLAAFGVTLQILSRLREMIGKDGAEALLQK